MTAELFVKMSSKLYANRKHLIDDRDTDEESNTAVEDLSYSTDVVLGLPISIFAEKLWGAYLGIIDPASDLGSSSTIELQFRTASI